MGSGKFVIRPRKVLTQLPKKPSNLIMLLIRPPVSEPQASGERRKSSNQHHRLRRVKSRMIFIRSHESHVRFLSIRGPTFVLKGSQSWSSTSMFSMVIRRTKPSDCRSSFQAPLKHQIDASNTAVLVVHNPKASAPSLRS